MKTDAATETELAGVLDRFCSASEARDVSGTGSVAWLLAEGTETAVTDDRVERHPYRMTMVLERREDQLATHAGSRFLAALSGDLSAPASAPQLRAHVIEK